MTESWIKAHERIILVIIAIAVSGWLISKWLNHQVEVDNARVAQTNQILSAQTQKTAEVTEEVKQMEQQYSALAATLMAQNQTLVAAVSARMQATQKQQVVDKTLPLPAVADRWVQLAGLQPTDVRNTDSGLAVTENGARTTVQQLELVPSLQADIADGRQLLTNKNTQIDGLNNVVTGLKSEVSEKDKQLTDQTVACKAQVADVTAKARKSKLKWFFAGVISGFVGGVLVH